MNQSKAQLAIFRAEETAAVMNVASCSACGATKRKRRPRSSPAGSSPAPPAATARRLPDAPPQRRARLVRDRHVVAGRRRAPVRAYSVEAMAASMCDMRDSGVDGKPWVASKGLHPLRPPPAAVEVRRETAGVANDRNQLRSVARQVPHGRSGILASYRCHVGALSRSHHTTDSPIPGHQGQYACLFRITRKH